MALIKCPECGKDVSDKAAICIHCGYPLEKLYSASQEKDMESDTTGVTNTPIELECPLCGSSEESIKLEEENGAYICQKCRKVVRVVNQSKLEAYYQRNKEKQSKNLSNIIAHEPMKRSTNTIICPKCGSSAITTGARGVSSFWGFIGAGKTVNRCGNCGHTWTPRG